MVIVCGVLAVQAACPGTCLAQEDAPASAALSAAVEKLLIEAKELDELESPKNPPVFTRPHPALVGIGSDQAAAVLDRMAEPFTGNEYRDTYIRWHLVEVLKQADAGSLRRQTQRIIKLLNAMPGPLQLPLLQEWKDEPQEIANRYHQLNGQTRTVVGYPPFERVHYGKDALAYMDPERRTKAEAIVAEMERLRPMWKRAYDSKAMTRNDRVRRVNWVVRQYRGELVYSLMLTGDPSVLPKCVDAVAKSLKSQDRAAFDILSFMYLAAFDGVLNEYPREALQQTSAALKALGRSAEAYTLYRDGQAELSPWAPQKERSFADYAFHLVYMLEEGPDKYIGSARQISRIPPPPDDNVRLGDVVGSLGGSPGSGAARDTIKPEELNVQTIRQATKLAVEALYALEPNYTFPDEHALARIYYAGRFGTHPMWQQVIHETGNHALACWAMLEAGESSQDPRIRRRLNWVLSGDAPFAYDRGMRAKMLANMPPVRWTPWVRREALWLGGAVTTGGNFGYQWTGGASEGLGDHANGQYGVLGMWSLQHAGYPVPEKAWGAIDQYWRSAQDPKSGGWSAISAGDRSAGTAGLQKTQTSGPMTAGGVMVLSLTERFLRGDDYKVLGKAKPQPHLQLGLDWLDKNFSLEDKSESADFFYYMWTVQSVGHASGYRTFNGVDWYRQVTSRLLSLQSKDGTWEDSKGKLLSTGFALLYLARANAPIAFGKVKYEGNWNNRPHDLLNFVEWASDRYETPLSWQIVSPELPLHELLESRVLYLAGDQPVKLSDAQLQGLKQYIEAGGLLVLSPEGSQPGNFIKSTDALATQLLGPDAKFEDLSETHTLYGLHQPVSARVRMAAVSSPVRPLIVRFNKDIASALQGNEQTQPDVFNAMSNLYLYATGMEYTRPRLDTNFVAPPRTAPTRSMKVARIRYQGLFDPEPYALKRLAAVMARDHGTALDVQTLDPSELTAEIKVAFLSATSGASLQGPQAEALKQWLQAGGTLWLDAAGGQLPAVKGAEQVLAQLAPQTRRVTLSGENPVISGKGLTGGFDNRNVVYRRQLLQRFGYVDRPRLFQVEVGGRPSIFFSSEDLTTGLAGIRHWNIYGYSPESAMQLVVNGLLEALSASKEKAVARE